MALTPQQFVQNWQNTALNERQSYSIHFMEVCDLVGHARPTGEGVDAAGKIFGIEYGIKKDSGGQGFADVFYEGHFAIEYKAPGKYKDLSEAYQQLLRYREQLNNPPLLVVTDIATWEIHTNWPNTEKKVYRFSNADIANRPSILKLLQDLFEAPERLHPDRNTAQVTTDAADVFHQVAEDMRRELAPLPQYPLPQPLSAAQRGEQSSEGEPFPSLPSGEGLGEGSISQRIAHFLTKLVFCLFAEDVGLLPTAPNSSKGIFAEIVEQTYREPSRFVRYAEELFKAMAEGGEVLFQRIPYFNGSLFDDVRVEQISYEALDKLKDAAKLNWESVEPAIFGTLFERSLDPSKRAQLGAHYTSREDILLIVEPVLMQPLRREWTAIQTEAAPIRDRLDAADTPKERIKLGKELEGLREQMLMRLRDIKVLDPACGSGNFLYVSLQLLMDMEKEVINHPLFAGLTLAMPEVHPRQMYGIEINPIAHDLATIVVWIGYIQWRQNNGYATLTQREPILEALQDNIRQMDAIMQVNAPLPQYPLPQPLSASQRGEQEYPLPPAPSPLRSEGEQFPSPRSGEGLGEGSMDTQPLFTRTTLEMWDKIKPLARQMRKEPTPAEDALWQRLRRKTVGGYKFRRQHPIDRFIVDFFCAEARLVIEVDGAIHDYTQEHDALRTEFLESRGLRVIRFMNGDVLQHMDRVLERIGEELNAPLPQYPLPPAPSPLRSEGGQVGASESPLLAKRGGDLGVGSMPSEPDWPQVDVIVGNPPFLGSQRMRRELGDDFVEKLRQLYENRVPGGADLVCYWYEKARSHIEAGKAKRAGLLATNSIRGGANREVLNRIKESGDIFMAWSDRDWVLDGAAVRVSMVGFDNGEETARVLDGKTTISINPDLTSSLDITTAARLSENDQLAFQGPVKVGAFDIPDENAQQMLHADENNFAVIKPYMNGDDIVNNPRNYWLIDFGTRSEDEASQFTLPFNYVEVNVKPEDSQTVTDSVGKTGGDLGEQVMITNKLLMVSKDRYFLQESLNIVSLFGSNRESCHPMP